MFTGLIGGLGRVVRAEKTSASLRLTIDAAPLPRELKIGDSIAVNGACLTITEKKTGTFTAEVMPETFRNSTLGSLRSGDIVNLEGALTMADALDGHLVAGHVEAVGRITAMENDEIANYYTVEVPETLTRYIVRKGSVAIDGISLTVTEVTPTTFTVSIIPHTAKVTILGGKKRGDAVNVETDMLAKYVEKLLGLPQEETNKKDGKLSKKILAENGFL